MDRRSYLAGVLGATGGLLAGCTGRRGADGGDDARAGRDGEPTDEGEPTVGRPVRRGDVDLPVPRSELRAPLPRDHIPAIVDPAFGRDWDDLTLPEESRGKSTRLPDDAPVVGVAADGRARAYPLRVLDWHEVVNDTFAGPIAVTYCVLCGSSVVVDRVLAGDPTVFGVSGYLWRSDLVLYDAATGSLWSQLLATAIDGPLTGTELAVRPASLTTWGAWREDHPGTDVLLPPPRSNTVRGREATFDYFVPKYTRDGRGVIGYEAAPEDRHPQSLVLGVAHGGVTRAYPFETVQREGVVNDRVGGRPVVVTVAPGDTLVAYDRRVDGRTLTFHPDGRDRLSAGGTAWRRSTGEGLTGPHAGERLARANDAPPMFWLGWSGFHPDTEVYGERGDGAGAGAATAGDG